MNADEERQLLRDLVTAALGALDSTRKNVALTLALRQVLMDHGLATEEEIDAMIESLQQRLVLDTRPNVVDWYGRWNDLVERLERALLRLSD